MNGKIYFIKNEINGKGYIGLTTQTIEDRFIQHTQRGYALFEAIKKYGKDNFSISVIEDGISDLETLNKKEKIYIRKLSTHVSLNGYNLTWGGETNSYVFCQQGREFSEETKLKMSENHANVSGSNNPRYRKMVVLTPTDDLILRGDYTQDLIDSFFFTHKFFSGEKFRERSKNEGFYVEFVDSYDFETEEKKVELMKNRNDWWYNIDSPTYRYCFDERLPSIQKQVNIFTDPDGNIAVTNTKKEFWNFCYELGVKPQDVKALRDGKREPFSKRSKFYGWKIKLGEINES